MKISLFFCLFFFLISLSGEAAGAAAGSWKFEEDDGGSHLVQTVELGSQAAEEDITQLEMRKSVTAAAPPTLRALSPNSGMMEAAAVIVRIENDEVMDIAMSGLRAREWVARNIVPYTRTIHITAITVGNEIIEHAVEEDEEKAKLSMFLLPAMRNVVKALVYWELDKEIKVSTRTSMLLLCSNCSPPSSGSFNPTHKHLVLELLDFLSESQAPFVINVDAFHLYTQASSSSSSSAQQQPPVQYFVFEPNSGLNDTVSRLHYSNFLEAVLDCVFLAMAAVVNQTHEKTMNIPITVALNSWPSSHELATTFNANLFNHLQLECQHQGTPLKPDVEIHIYINDDDGLGVAGILSLPTTNDLLSSSFSSSSTPSDHPRQQQSPHLRRLLQQEEWCVAKSGQAQSALQTALDWACGSSEGQVDCSAIQSTGVCYLPNDLEDHCSWAFNQYFQAHSTGSDSCNFGGTATITTTNPSTSTCTYIGTTGSGNTSTGFNSTSGNGNSSSSSISNFMQPQPPFWIAVVMAITYLLSGQAF
ncbi:unnamed protein product [Sphagnum jensenii]|uniref:X8 domain-containing protein n=1 Tax=Sphagnum jensenii TaxID=128206 RepID=A0ABP0W7V5_9BRYO